MESEKSAWSLEGAEAEMLERLNTNPLSVLREFVFSQLVVSYTNEEIKDHIIDCGSLGVLLIYWGRFGYNAQWIDSLERLNVSAVEKRIVNRQKELLSWMPHYKKMHRKDAPHFKAEHSTNKAALEMLHEVKFRERDALKEAFDKYAGSVNRGWLATEMANIIHRALVGPYEATEEATG